ncbi:MAG: DUF3500 domain-containing protein [Pseudomonadota bacterium]
MTERARAKALSVGSQISRRDMIAGAAAAGGALMVAPTLALAAAPATGAQMAAAATDLLAALDEAQRAAATFAVGGRRWLRWNYMTGSAFSPGVPMERMTAAQKERALTLLQSGLSQAGFDKAKRVMLQQDILRDLMKKGSQNRNRDRFSVMVFGEPGASGIWGWRWEGHHLSLTYTLDGPNVVSVTPNSFSSEPNTVWDGPHKGMTALPDEERLGRQIFADLSPKLQALARFQDRSPGNVRATAGREGRIKTRAGVPLSDLTTPQRDLVVRLLDVYTSDHLPADLAGVQKARAREGDLNAARFAWAGDETREGASIYYRLHGDTFLIEFASLHGQPLHLHTAVHDRQRNLGRHVRG